MLGLIIVSITAMALVVGCGEEDPTATPVPAPTQARRQRPRLHQPKRQSRPLRPSRQKRLWLRLRTECVAGRSSAAYPVRSANGTTTQRQFGSHLRAPTPLQQPRQVRSFRRHDHSPDLATEWSIGDDADSFTFTIRDGVKFHDGQDLTLEDIEWTFERSKSPPEGERYPRLLALQSITDITIVDDNTITIEIENPNVEFIQNFAAAWGIVFAQHVMEQEGGMKGPDRVVGTGPFIIDEAEMEEFVTSRSNPDYFIDAPDGDPFPYLDEMTTVALSDVEARIAAIQTGRVDIASFDPAEFAPAVGALNAIGDTVRMEISPLAGINYLSMNANGRHSTT